MPTKSSNSLPNNIFRKTVITKNKIFNENRII